MTKTCRRARAAGVPRCRILLCPGPLRSRRPLYVTSLYVRYRGHTTARQARQHGQEKRPCRPAWLDEAHRVSALSRE
eukprot:4837099-Prymnesium_polylepis.1